MLGNVLRSQLTSSYERRQCIKFILYLISWKQKKTFCIGKALELEIPSFDLRKEKKRLT